MTKKIVLKVEPMVLQKIIEGINKKDWWRTALPKNKEIIKRGIFFASNYQEAEFYGRPIDVPFNVKIKKPYISSPDNLDKDVLGEKLEEELGVEARFKADEMIKKKLEDAGYDSVIIVADRWLNKALSTGRLPKAIELNVFNVKYWIKG